MEITPEELQIIEEVKEVLTQEEGDKFIMLKKLIGKNYVTKRKR